VEFLVVERFEDVRPAGVSETLEDRLVRIRDREKREKLTKFPGGIYIDSDATAEVSSVARKAFTAQGLPACMSATLKRVFNRQTGLNLLMAHPKPIHGPEGNEASGTPLRYFFITGPNKDGNDWSGSLREDLIVLGRNGKPHELLLPPRWVPYEKLCGVASGTHRTALQRALKEIIKRKDKLFSEPPPFSKPLTREGIASMDLSALATGAPDHDFEIGEFVSSLNDHGEKQGSGATA
jgi:hypothetical protein